jgi:hypothetical protein
VSHGNLPHCYTPHPPPYPSVLLQPRCALLKSLRDPQRCPESKRPVRIVASVPEDATLSTATATPHSHPFTEAVSHLHAVDRCFLYAVCSLHRHYMQSLNLKPLTLGSHLYSGEHPLSRAGILGGDGLRTT